MYTCFTLEYCLECRYKEILVPMEVDRLVWIELAWEVISKIHGLLEQKNTELLSRSFWNSHILIFPMTTVRTNFNTIGQAIWVPLDQYFQKSMKNNDRYSATVLYKTPISIEDKVLKSYFHKKNWSIQKFESIVSKIKVLLVRNLVLFWNQTRNMFERDLNLSFVALC